MGSEVEASDALTWLRGKPDRSCDLYFTSPPYEGQRTYGIDFVRRGQQWVDWLRPMVVEMARSCKGLVLVNMASPVCDHKYTAAVEWLVTDLTRQDGLVCGPSPYVWFKAADYDDADGNATPGSGGKHYQRRDWEPVYAFCLPDRLPLAWSDNTAFGRPPRNQPGGPMSNRDVNGVRANDPWKTATRGGGACGGRRKDGSKQTGIAFTARRANGVRRDEKYAHPKIANPGNVVRVPVGGGKIGGKLAHAGEAPMSVRLAERFVCWFCPPGGLVRDPFTGTGTTAVAAAAHGRNFQGCDVRESQVELTRRRLSGVTPGMF